MSQLLVSFTFFQVLSKTTADCLTLHGLHYTQSTIRFLKIFDRVFDCLNVNRRFQDKGGKAELAEYTLVHDWRFEVRNY